MTAPDFCFTPLTEADLVQLYGWLQRPHVAAWWPPPESDEATREAFFPVADESGDARYIARIGDRPVGFVQSYLAIDGGNGWWSDQHDRGVVGIDLFLAEESLLGRGIGTAMIRQFVARLFQDPSIHTVQVDPDPTNRRAVRSFEKAGFRPDRPVVTPDGPALLMHADRTLA